MAAGESAREVARRARERSDQLARRAESFERGAEGEERTAQALADLPQPWSVFHDVKWPGRKYANIDHVVVGPGGVFVVDTKNWSGRLEVKSDVLRQNGRSRETTVAATAEAAIAVAQLASTVSVTQVSGVLCFVRDEPIAGWARDVMVCSTSNLTAMLLSRSHVLTDEAVRETALQLDAQFRAAARSATPVVRRSARPPAATVRTRRSSRPSRAEQRRRQRQRGDLWKLLVAGGAAWLLLTQPDLVADVTRTFGEFWVSLGSE